jgi:hypothetical protein
MQPEDSKQMKLPGFGDLILPDKKRLFWDVIFTYSRQQALEDGVQIDVSATAREAGIVFPVFLTSAVFDKFVEVPLSADGQDMDGRLWDIVWMLRLTIQSSLGGDPERLPFEVLVRNDNRRPKLIHLVALCGPLDINDARPAITVMMPGED